MPDDADGLRHHVSNLRACRACAGVEPPPVVQPLVRPVLEPRLQARAEGSAEGSAEGAGGSRPGRIYLRGQAPGIRERDEGRAFCGPSGRTLFRWFASIGAGEAEFRERVFMGAVTRCFPGRIEGRQGDRRPAPGEW